MPGRELGSASEHCVFVYLHQTKSHTKDDYDSVTAEFLPEEFNHPIFLFLRPDGTEVNPELRHEHEYQSASQIATILKKEVWPETGKGLTPREWKKAEEAVEAARAALLDGDPDGAVKEVRRALRYHGESGVADRAEMLKEDALARQRTGEDWAKVSEGVAGVPEIVGPAIARGDLIGALRAVEAMRDPPEAISMFGKRLERELRERFEITRAEPVLLLHGGTGHHYLEVCFRNGMALRDLTVEICVVSQAGRVLESHTRLESVPAGTNQEVCASLTAFAMEGSLVRAMRVRLYSGGVLLAERIGLPGNGKLGAPEPWPEPVPAEVTTGPDFFQPGEAFHTRDGLVPTAIRVGRAR